MTTLSPNSLIIQVEGELITDKRAKKHGTAKKLWNKGVMPDQGACMYACVLLYGRMAMLNIGVQNQI